MNIIISTRSSIDFSINSKVLPLIIATLLLISTGIMNASAQNTSGEVNLTEEEKNWIADNPAIKASSSTYYAPFDFVSVGLPAGLSIDYLNLVAAKVGLKIEYVNYQYFSEMLEGAKKGEVDITHSIYRTKEREEHFLMSLPYYYEPLANFGRAGSPRINSLADLEGLRIGMATSHIVTEEYKKNHSHLNLIEYPNHLELFEALIAGKVDIFTGEINATEFFLSQMNAKNIEVIGDDYIMKDFPTSMHIAVTKTKPILMDILNKGMVAIKPSEFNTIADKWIKKTSIAHNIGLTQNELDWIENNSTIITAAASDSPPHGFINSEGNMDGITGDILNEISKRLGVKFEWSGNETWNEGLSEIQTKNADVFSSITPTEERAKYFLFTKPYATQESAIFTRIDAQQFTNLESLKGYTVAQVTGTSSVEYLTKNYPEINIIQVENTETALALLSRGDVNAMTGDILNITTIIYNSKTENIGISGITPYDFSIAIGVRKDLPLLASAIDKALADISETRKQEIFNKWLLLKITPNIDYSDLWKVILIGIALLTLTLIWNGKLTVAKKEALKAKQIAENASKSKTMFLANISHDLKTPLNSLLLLSRILQNNSSNNLTKTQLQHVNAINESGSVLSVLIDDLLDRSQLDAKQLVLREEGVILQNMSDYILSVFKPQADEAGIDFTLTIDEKLPPNFTTDKQRFYQIIRNLISNAIKFTDKGSVTVEVKPHISTDNNVNQILFSVTDTGIGIGKTAQSTIFDTFTQGDENISRKYGGTGLGLSISKELTNLLGGKITVESSFGYGSTFTLFLPLHTKNDFEIKDLTHQRITSNDKNNSQLNNKALNGKTVLLVDDDARNVFSLSEALNQYGIKSIVAKSGVDAIAELKVRSDINLVLMDMMMPGMDGDDAISRIRFMAKHEHLPIISITASAHPKDRQKCIDAGANDHLTKPIDIETLISKMLTWLK